MTRMPMRQSTSVCAYDKSDLDRAANCGSIFTKHNILWSLFRGLNASARGFMRQHLRI